MKNLGDRGPRRDDESQHDSDFALAKERSTADSSLKRERALLDETVTAMHVDDSASPIVRQALLELREKIRRQRVGSDGATQHERHLTDDAIRLRYATSIRGLWAAMGELDVIVSATEAIRKRSAGQPGAPQFLALSNEIDLSAEKLLEIVGHILAHDEERDLK